MEEMSKEVMKMIDEEECLTKFTPIPALKNETVRSVACGQYHTMCLLKNGTVYQWGEV